MSLAFVFPGQGSQSVGMLSNLANTYPQVKMTFEQASAILDYDLWELTRKGPQEDLNRTDRTQPAMLSAGVATWRIWLDRGGAMPSLLAGHSLGEYTALVCGGAMAFEDAVSVVADRGRFMQEAVPEGEGAMAAILGLDNQQVIDVCLTASTDGIVSAVNFNAPGQVVIAGNSASVARAIDGAKVAGARRAIALPVSVPSHCELMRPAATRLAHRLEGVPLRAPEIPVINNVDVGTEAEPSAIRDALARQLYNPVRWVESIEALAARGISTIVECGPGQVLSGLLKRIDKGLHALPVSTPETLDAALRSARHG